MKQSYFLIALLFFGLQALFPEQLLAQCNAPTGLSATNVSQTGAYLYLTPTSTNAGTFNIRYHGGTTTTWTTVEHVTLPYQLGNIACGTTYEWQAQQVCTNSVTGAITVSDWSVGGTFATLACTPPPVCNAPTGLAATGVTQTGAYLYAGTTAVAGLFNIRYHGGTTTTWTTLEHVTLPYQLGNLACGTTYEWQAQLICTNSATGSTTASDWSTGTAFTTLACTPPPTCNAPTGLSATNISQTGANLYLTPTSTNTGTFNIRYHGGNTTTWTTLEHVTLPYQLGNLTCGTTYEWQAQLVCPNSNPTVSAWSTGAAFTTLACTPPPTCNAPTGLSATNISQTGAYLYLTPTSTNTGTFNIRYHGGNTTTWTTLEHVTLPYQLGNLTCGTTYEWQAQLVCTNAATAVSAWSIGAAFTTLACTPPPTCNTPTGLSATNVSQTGANLYLTPTSTNTGTFNIRYHGGNTTTWTTLEHVTLPYQLGNLTCGTTYEWQAQLVCPNSNPTVSAWSTGAAFTTLACTPPPTCNQPTGLAATGITQTGAYLYAGTTAVAGLFNIRYHGGNTTTWTTLEHITLPYQLANLACGTTYEWQAQLICTNSATGSTTVSDWSTGAAFTTLACTPPPTCNAPTGLSATNVSQTGANLYLVPTSTNTGTFNIRYHGGNTTTWTTLEHITLPYQLANLTCGTTYEWQAQLVCPNSNPTVSAWSTGAAFTTLACTPPPTCNAPTGLSATNISQTGAYLYLTPTSTNTGTFNIRYHGGNTTTWTTLEHVTLPYQLGNLTCGTTYEWQAQLVCTNAATAVSTWSTGVAFTTLACTPPPTCNAPTGLSATNVSQTGANLYLTPTSTNTGTFNIRYHGGNTTTWTTLEHVTLPYQLGNLTCGTTYEWQAQLVCPNNTGTAAVSAWSTGAAFTTMACTPPPTCNAPVDLSASNISFTSATLHWNAVSGAIAYIVYYKKANIPSINYTTVTSTTNSVTINGLNAGTAYVWQVQAVCSTSTSNAGSTSPMSTAAVFLTSGTVVFPNPANQSINITFWSTSAARMSTIELRNYYGQLVYSMQRQNSNGINEFALDTSELSDGLYILTIRSNDINSTSKVIIKH